MAIDFPGSPNPGDTFTSGTTTWSWDGTKWEPAPAGNWTEAPSDNRYYSRRNLTWSSNIIKGDAPTDGQVYRRQMVGGQMAWVVDPIVVDAPAAVGQYYGRVNGAWGALSPTFTLKTYVDAQDTAILNSANAHTDVIAVPIGGIVMYGSPNPPPNFLNCDGTVYNVTSVPKLNAVIGGRFGGDGSTTCGVPNLGGRFPISTTIGAVGGAGSFSIAVGNLPPHQHLVPAHGHGFNDPGHNHSQSPHGHGINDPGHAHSVANQNQVPAGPGGVNVAWTGGGSTGGSGTGISIQAQYANINAAGTSCSIASNGPWATDGSWGQGSGSAIGLYPPYMGFNFIIRYQ
jgi:microcystin-dependent protein